MAIIKNPITVVNTGGGSGPEPLCFETVDSTLASNAQSLTITNEGGNAPVLQYSYNKNTWTNWDYSALPFGGTTKLYIRGMNMGGFSKSESAYSTFGFSGNPLCKCSGNIMSLVNYNSQQHRVFPYEFCKLFYYASKLTTAPALPSTTLSSNCYNNMFRNCTSLTTAPALPATTLAIQCYSGMFDSCESLTTAPALPATTLASGCYHGMFDSCISLTTIPSLPATVLESSCYYGMFGYCTNIKMSETQEGEYQNAYTFGTTPSSTYAGDMFAYTGGTFTGTPTAQTYYTSNTIVSA